MKRPFLNLGPLEREIMELIWKSKKTSVRQILEKLRKKRQIAYTTIMTVMNRLCDKGLLGRQKKQKSYFYYPLEEKEIFLSKQSEKTIHRLLKEYGETAIVQFLDLLKKTELKEIKRWRKKLQKFR